VQNKKIKKQELELTKWLTACQEEAMSCMQVL
jgi:hypothetical protein